MRIGVVKEIKQAERRVEVLLKRKDGTFAREPFETEEG